MPTQRSPAVPRALAAGKLPNDARLGPLKDLNGYFPFTPPATPEAWATRAERVRRQMLVALGLWPMPPRSPLNAVIHGRIDRGDHTVEKVFFESHPRFFVTGNLYRPKSVSGRVPGVLYPHGHWQHGRFHDAGVDVVRKQIVAGAERFEEGGRSPLQAICVQLAQMGCVTFHWDMIGYADSIQLSFELAHGFARQRPEMTTTENWGLFSPQAEMHCQSIMGLQTWSSMRALDFLLTLPEVDPDRIAVTGGSGGGTQTMILGALDPRPAMAFPAVMVSTAMQGGCTCENASGLRIGTGNVEFAALFAPKPQGMTTANDWTREMSTKGFPELKQLYTQLGVPDRVMLQRGEHFEHNYNYVSRAAFCHWLNRQFKLGLREPIVAGDYKRLTKDEMSVWDAAHPQPPAGPEFERELLRWLTDAAARQLAAAAESAREFRKVYGGAVDIVIGRNLAEVGEIEWHAAATRRWNCCTLKTGLLRNTTHCEELPVVILEPKTSRGRTVVWIDAAGKAGLFDASVKAACQCRPEIAQLLKAGVTVIGVDLLYQGEFLDGGTPVTQTRRVENPRAAPAYTFGYNPALFAQRVQDVLSVVAFAQSRGAKRIDLVGLAGAGPWVAAARAQCGDVVTAAVVDTGAFRFGKILEVHSTEFLPGGAKYGDLPGMLALNAPGRLWLAGEDDAGFAFVQQQYALTRAKKALSRFTGAPTHVSAAAVEFLLAKP